MQQFVSCDESTLFSIIMEKENSCVWKVTTSGGIQFFTEPLLWEEGYLFLFNSCKIYHAKMSWSAFRWCKLILVYTSSFQIANPQKIHPPGKSCFNSLESPFLLGQRPTPKKKKKRFQLGWPFTQRSGLWGLELVVEHHRISLIKPLQPGCLGWFWMMRWWMVEKSGVAQFSIASHRCVFVKKTGGFFVQFEGGKGCKGGKWRVFNENFAIAESWKKNEW